MYWLWIFITVVLGAIVLACLSSTLILIFDGDKNFIWYLSGAIIFGIATYFSVEKVKFLEQRREPKCTTISTSTLPIIDTTITYYMGKADTVYTYHFMMED